MVALATQQDKTFIASLLEAPEDGSGKKGQQSPNYSIETLRRLKQSMKSIDRIFFLIGIDAFNDIAKWHQADAIFRECEFVVASRPGYSLADVANALPEKLRPKKEVTTPFKKQPAKGDLVLSGVTIHLLDDVQQNVSATAVREAVAGNRPLTRFLDAAVADYIKKMGLYK
jgi:nicotinate-nucleotide adenylyltransferase